MAIFLTIGCIEILMGRAFDRARFRSGCSSNKWPWGLAGVAVGYAAIRIVNAINLDAAGLYPVLVTAFGLLAFGLAVIFGGSGFLAIYLAGIVIGNGRLVFQRILSF